MSGQLKTNREAHIADLLIGAVDLHCHSGPAAMPRILDHRDAMEDADDAGFAALVYKDHFYLGVAHASILETLHPARGIRLFSGLALNNACGGINPHAVDHAAKIGAKIVWLPTLSAANHIRQAETGAKGFPKTARKMLDATPLSTLGSDGRVTDETKLVLDIIAESDMILAGGHLSVPELAATFEEARRRGVRKMLVNHPNYIVNCTDADIRDLVGLGAYMEHSICLFVSGVAKHNEPAELVHLIEVAGVERTILCSDLGLMGSQRPVAGYREIVGELIDASLSDAAIRTMVGENASRLLSL
ncbi:conserved hypothetical protein [Hyphomicrobiales bacterium]|nr:conserved hypothetical protein [Hyphomicrobiales bacterium]CAH1675532.1 conserved hypothetical protein [Hyphomicrobiales bacterium]